MNNKYHLSLFAYALILAYPALGASQFTPFPPTPLNLQPKPADMVPPNVLFFIDNSYDSCRGAKTGRLCNIVTGEPIGGEKNKFKVSQEVVKEVTSLSKYKGYRFGAAAYPMALDSLNFYRGKQCGVQSWRPVNKYGSFDSLYEGNSTAGYYNWRITPCYGELHNPPAPHSGLIHYETGAIIYAPITADQNKFAEGIDTIPAYKSTVGFGYSPMSSAYLELTRYYRGLTSGTNKENFSNVGNSQDAWMGQNYKSPIEYRCQPNNIVFINSAEDIRIQDQNKETASFYKAFHEDPLYWHDNPEFSLDAKNMKFKAINDDRPGGQLGWKEYNKNFKQDVFKILLSNPYLLNTVQNLQTQSPVRYNPFFDHTSIAKAGKIQNADSSKTTTDEKVIDFVQYHEKRSIEGFAHLAFEGDILKDKHGVKKVNGSETDKDGMRWDGTSKGDSVRNSKQNIRTFTVNFQLAAIDYEEFEVERIGESILNRYVYFVRKPNQVIDDGDYLFYKGKPVRTGNGKSIKTSILFGDNEEGGLIPYYVILSEDVPSNIKAGEKIQIISKKQIDATTGEFKDSNATEAAKLLQRTGEKGGGGFTSVSGGAAGLKKTLEHILDQISPATISLPVGGSVGISDAAITSAVTPTLDTDRWASELRFYDLKPDGLFSETKYEEPNYSEKSTTLISTKEGVRSLSTKKQENGITFNNETFNIGDPFNLPANSTVDHGNKGGLKVANSKRDDEWSVLARWLLRSTANDKDDLFSAPLYGGIKKPIYRDRGKNRNLGDILDSNILMFGGEKHPLSGLDGKKQYGGNHPYIAVGANDGMLHLYKAYENTAKKPAGKAPYFHQLAYIPGTAKRTSEKDTIIRNLVYTAEQNYGSANNPHQYFVNGGVFYRKTDSGVASTVDNGQIMLTGSLGQGGKAAYALNIGGYEYGSLTQKTGLDSTDWSKNVPLWDTSSDKFGDAKNGVDDKMGYPIGRPQVGRVSMTDTTGKAAFEDLRFATFLNNGVGGSTPPTLFVLDQLGKNVAPGKGGEVKGKPGQLLKALVAGTETGGLAAPLFVDYDRDGMSDFVYAGDSNGNMWRFDLRFGKDKWGAKQIFKGSKSKPITTKPAIYYDGNKEQLIVYFGTGSALYQNDLKSLDTQTMYAVVDRFNTCDVEGKTFKGKDSKTNCEAVKDGDLFSRTITRQTYADQKVKVRNPDTQAIEEKTLNLPQYRRVDVEKLNIDKLNKGWKLDLIYNGKKEGERIITSPAVVADSNYLSGSVLFTTRIYNDGNADKGNPSCSPPPMNITSWIMALDAKTGGNPGRINLGKGKVLPKDGNDQGGAAAGMYTLGAASDFLMESAGGEIDGHGGGTDGTATTPKAPGEPISNAKEYSVCKRGSANTVVTVQDPNGNSTILRFELDCGGAMARRLSWREIF